MGQRTKWGNDAMREDGYETLGGLQAYKLRLRRKRLLWQIRQAGRSLNPLADRSTQILPGDHLAFACLRNESLRLPHWLDHYRALGVSHFLIVDNASDDGTLDMLCAQPDVSVWQAAGSYRAARFGMDWLGALHQRFGAGHWCLTVDADELLILPHHKARTLPDLTAHLDSIGVESFGAMMLDMYPQGALGAGTYQPGTDPTSTLPGFDPDGYWWRQKGRYGYLDIRGGARERAFFGERPLEGPHLHKVPLIRWQPGFCYVSSMHFALPRRLNRVFDARDGRPTGVLLHTKFLPDVIARTQEDTARQEHFTHPNRYVDYRTAVTHGPNLWHPRTQRYAGWEQLEELGLMTRGTWH